MPLCVSLAMVVGIVAGTAPASAQPRAEEDDSRGLVSGLVALLSPRPSALSPAPSSSPLPASSSGLSPAEASGSSPAGPAASGSPKSGPALPTASPEASGARPGPGRQWTLTASKLKLIGSRYHGYSMQEVEGRQVKTLHFTAQRLEITDLVQRGALGNGTVMRAASAPGRVSTITDGPIHLYTRRLTGTPAVADHPLAPVTLSPDSLAMPNLDLGFLQLPKLTFTDVTAHNVELSGGTLFIPDARITVVGR